MPRTDRLNGRDKLFREPPDDPRGDCALDERRCGMRRPRVLMIPEAGPTGDADDI